MNLKNIIIDFLNNENSVMFDEKHYGIDTIEEIENFKTMIEIAYNVTFDRLIFQLSFDQHLSDPRILCIGDENQSIIHINDIETNNIDIFESLQSIISIVESKLTDLLNSNL